MFALGFATAVIAMQQIKKVHSNLLNLNKK